MKWRAPVRQISDDAWQRMALERALLKAFYATHFYPTYKGDKR